MAVAQTSGIIGQRPVMICDRGYRDKYQIGATSSEISEAGIKTKTAHEKRQARECFCHRAAPLNPSLDILKVTIEYTAMTSMAWL